MDLAPDGGSGKRRASHGILAHEATEPDEHQAAGCGSPSEVGAEGLAAKRAKVPPVSSDLLKLDNAQPRGPADTVRRMLRGKTERIGESDVLKRVRQFLPAMASADSALRSKVAAVEGGKDTLDIEVLTDNEKYVEMNLLCGLLQDTGEAGDPSDADPSAAGVGQQGASPADSPGGRGAAVAADTAAGRTLSDALRASALVTAPEPAAPANATPKIQEL